MIKMKKIKLFVFTLCAMFVAVVGVSADTVSTTYSDDMLQAPEDATGSDTYIDNAPSPSIVSTDGNKHVTVTYSTGSFKLVQKNGYDDAAWPGIKILAPSNYDYSNVGEEDNKGPIYYSNGDRSQKKYFKNNEDTTNKNQFTDGVDHYLLSYYAITKEFLETAVEKEAKIVYYTEFDWNADGTIDQTITVIIDPTNLTLTDEDGEDELWNHDIYQEEVKEVMTDVYSDLEGAISVAKGIDKSKYTAESVKALEEAIENAEDYGKDLTKNNQTAIRNLTKAITTAIANLVENGDESVKPGSSNPSNTDEKAPNTFDAGLVYMGLALSAIGASVVSIKKLRNN